MYELQCLVFHRSVIFAEASIDGWVRMSTFSISHVCTKPVLAITLFIFAVSLLKSIGAFYDVLSVVIISYD